MSKHSTILISRNYYQIALITLFVVFLWVAISVYRALSTPAPIGVDASTLSPVSPTIDQATVASLSARTQLSQSAATIVQSLVATSSASFAPPSPIVQAQIATTSASSAPSPTP